ncbi:MBL fold metallo-hydrolase [bacterium SCSIO 12741]|nr:MBL fold metallo-hydrolase [bacterium SCSIO 12741]
MKKLRRMVLWTILAVLVIIGVGLALFLNLAPQIGGTASGDRLARMENSPQFDGGIFVNPVETNMDMSAGNVAKMTWEFIRGVDHAEPEDTIRVQPFQADDFANTPEEEVAITWFGHSSAIVRIEGKTLLIDPVFSERASLFSFMGPKRFIYSKHMSVDQLPDVDAVLISHDHYDHLDYETMLKLKEKVNQFYVPLGVGAHLESWGIPSNQIQELDWWQESEWSDSLKLVCTPARHFSGRALTDRFKTLWCSWVIQGKNKRVYFSGDSGYTPQFKEIGDKYGPFDLCMMECGQYDEKWSNIHMMPEETVQAHLDLQGKYLVPIHWGKFNLALHSWKDPVQRMTAKAKEKGVYYLIPEVGHTFTLNTAEGAGSNWWQEVE